MARRRVKGEGTIYQRKDGRWVAEYGGKYRYAKDSLEALDRLNDLKAAEKQNSLPQEITVSDLVKPWLLLKSHSLRPQSYDRLESTIERHITGRLGDVPFKDLTDTMFVEVVYDSMKREGLSYSSIKKAYDALNACLKYHKAKGNIVINPIEAMGPPTKVAYEVYSEDGENDGAVIALTQEQRKSFLTALEAKYSNGKLLYANKDAYIFALYTGVRLGELLALKWSNVNLDKKTVRISATLIFSKDRDPKSPTFGRKVFKISPYTKNSKPRQLGLNRAAYNAIVQLKAIADAKGSGLVVSSKGGGVARPNVVEKTFASICDTAGIELPTGYSMHVLRHTFASMLFSKGVHVKVVSELLGHSSVQITMNTYIDLIQEQNLESIHMIDIDDTVDMNDDL